MPFRTGTGSAVSFDRAFENLESLASAVKNLSQQLRDRSANDQLNGSHIQRYFTDLGNVRSQLEGWAAMLTPVAAAANAYAQDRYNDPTYSATTEYTAMNTEIGNTLTFIAANVPTDLLTWDAAGGVVSWNSFSAAATATLRTQLDALIATVD